MAKGGYKGTILADALTYRAWRATFVAEGKPEKLWKYIDSSEILPGPDPSTKNSRSNNNHLQYHHWDCRNGKRLGPFGKEDSIGGMAGGEGNV